jgi:NAD(P)-dependent dehydrogenase (short-subunit alcohol dehydrogenase family)
VITAPRVAVITGAAGGIGRATVDLLSKAGTRIVAVDLLEPDLGDIRIAGDLTDDAVNRRMIEAAEAEFGSVDAVILNAGVLTVALLEKLDLADFDRMHAVNTRAVLLGIRAAAPALRRAGGGAIVATSSVVASGAGKGHAAYAASKAAVSSLVRHAALELAVHHIRVNAVCPGPVETPMTAGLQDRPDLHARMCRNVPAGRFCEPAEIAVAIAFLASPDATYVTGVELPVDGGISATSGFYAPFS